MARIVAFGELLLRLNAPGAARLLQAPQLEAGFGGAEFNVLASLARFGLTADYVTVLPDNALGDAALSEIRAQGVGHDHALREPGRMGLYFLEAGSNMRPAKVLYDRADSAFASLDPDRFDWNSILGGADWLHLTGITPALGPAPAAAALAAARIAQARGIPVSLDVNYRRHLWQASGQNAAHVLMPLIENASLLFASAADCHICLETAGHEDDGFDQAARLMFQRVPGLEMIASTFREQGTADRQFIHARVCTRSDGVSSRRIEIASIVDRIGAGDAFAAGMIYGRIQDWPLARSLDFAITAAALKHTIPGDTNRVSVAEIEAASGDGAGMRVDR